MVVLGWAVSYERGTLVGVGEGGGDFDEGIGWWRGQATSTPDLGFGEGGYEALGQLGQNKPDSG